MFQKVFLKKLKMLFQNNLLILWCEIQFVVPALAGTINIVGARCTCPIISGHMQYAPTIGDYKQT